MKDRNSVFASDLLRHCGAGSWLGRCLAPRKHTLRSPGSHGRTSPQRPGRGRHPGTAPELLRLSPVLTTVVAHDPSLLPISLRRPQQSRARAIHGQPSRHREESRVLPLQPARTSDAAVANRRWSARSGPICVPPRPQSRPQASGRHARHGPHHSLPGLLFCNRVDHPTSSSRAAAGIAPSSSKVKIHGRLIDKFSSSQELAAYMETEAGKRFLEGVTRCARRRYGSLAHAQYRRARAYASAGGIVLALSGIGLLLLRNAGPDMGTPMTCSRYHRPDAGNRVYSFRRSHLDPRASPGTDARKGRCATSARRPLAQRIGQ